MLTLYLQPQSHFGVTKTSLTWLYSDVGARDEGVRLIKRLEKNAE